MVIYGCYVLAVALAIGNFIFFQILDQRLVAKSIPQTYVSNAANAIVRLFSMSLVLASSTAFTQLLWRQLRLKCLKVSTIDGLMSVPTAATELLSRDMLQATTILWLFGVILQLIPIASIFPPGALIVSPRLVPATENISVPTFDVRFRGNGSLNAMYNTALFLAGSDGWYRNPNDFTLRIAKSALLNGEHLTSKSPCGLNCSYAIEFDGPDYKCELGYWAGLENRTFEFYGAFSSYKNNQEARMEYSPPANFLGAPSDRDAKFYFDVQYGPGGVANMSCTYFASTYHANVTFLNGSQTVDVTVERKYLLNATTLGYPYLFAPYQVVDPEDEQNPAAWNKPFPDDIVLYNKPDLGSPNITVSDAFHDSNIRAIADAVSFTLGGMEGEFVGNTLIAQTPWVSTTKAWFGTTYDFSQLSPRLYEEMLRNVTISMLARPNTNITANVTRTGFIVFGIVALVQNGIPAESGGFMQVLCTTTGDNLVINREASACSMGGAPSFSNDLKELKVRFGYVKGTEGDEWGPRAVFGTEDETVPLGK
ncbi:hypothetical protein UCDDS831_g00688 [Diplodia seriata]|uniref:Uncharacterized protein n=1 Tax=Diplodia seriata TaxID=420778 RepID=A0A0G2F0E4_9PEZI|nr:hypothetical protein UCDDS831_g00688 [Diplodia seriata]